MAEIDLGIDFSSARTVKEIGDERERIAVFLRDLVKTAEVDTKTERTVFLADEQNRGTMSRSRRANESDSEVLVDEIAERTELGLRQRIHRTHRGRCAFFEIDFEIVGTVWCQSVCFLFAEYVSELVILLGDRGEIDDVFRSGRRSN